MDISPNTAFGRGERPILHACSVWWLVNCTKTSLIIKQHYLLTDPLKHAWKLKIKLSYLSFTKFMVLLFWSVTSRCRFVLQFYFLIHLTLFTNLNHLSYAIISYKGFLYDCIKWSSLVCSIATLPPEVGTLTSLKQLHIAHNELTGLPSEIGLLTSLEVLKVNNNR